MKRIRRWALLTVAAALASAQSSNQVRLGLFTAEPVKWDVEANWRVFEQVLAARAALKPDVVVTPECFLDGYAAAAKDWTPERFERIAQDRATSPYVARVRMLAEKYRTQILFGLTETHLQNHDLRVTAGGDLPAFDLPWGKTGVLICADRRWPETARVLRLKGARLLLVPSYGMWGLDNEWWMRTRAYENENFLAFVHPKVAFVADPDGKVMAKLETNVPDMLVVDVDLSKVHEHRHLRDRRPELYGEITKEK
jgi:predicted amidohydrolase